MGEKRPTINIYSNKSVEQFQIMSAVNKINGISMKGEEQGRKAGWSGRSYLWRRHVCRDLQGQDRTRPEEVSIIAGGNKGEVPEADKRWA